MSTVVLLSTRRLQPEYFETVRDDLGGDPDLTLDVVGWLPPAAVIDDKVESFTHIGPGRMPVAGEIIEEAPEPRPLPSGTKRVVQAARWRYRRAMLAAEKKMPTAIKTSAPVRFLTGNRGGTHLGKAYWRRLLNRPDAQSTIERADVVVALDAGAIWAGWNLGRLKPETPVVLGLPAARRELEQLKASAGNG